MSDTGLFKPGAGPFVHWRVAWRGHDVGSLRMLVMLSVVAVFVIGAATALAVTWLVTE